MITEARIIGVGVDGELYRKQTVPRGHPDYVMGRSDLLEFLNCPEKWLRMPPDDDGSTDATQWGSLMDCLILEPEKFEKRYCVKPEKYPDSKTGELKDWNSAAKFCKEWREAKLAENPSFTFLSASGRWGRAESEAALARFQSDDRFRGMLEGAKRQVHVVGTWVADNKRRIPIKALIDVVPTDESLLADVKTCCNGAPGVWPRVMRQRGYDMQAALYLDLWNSAMGQERVEFAFLCQENVPPFQTSRNRPDAEMIQLGRDRYRVALEQYAKCLEVGKWPDYQGKGGRHKVIDGWSYISPEPWMLTDDSDFFLDPQIDADSEDEDKANPPEFGV